MVSTDFVASLISLRNREWTHGVPTFFHEADAQCVSSFGNVLTRIEGIRWIGFFFSSMYA